MQSWGWLGGPHSVGRRYVRHIALERPGAEDLALVTDLLDADAVRADDLLWLYQERWGIERLFQKVTEVFGLAGLIGSRPQACIFQFAFCMLLYNLVQLLADVNEEEPVVVRNDETSWAELSRLEGVQSVELKE